MTTSNCGRTANESIDWLMGMNGVWRASRIVNAISLCCSLLVLTTQLVFRKKRQFPARLVTCYAATTVLLHLIIMLGQYEQKIPDTVNETLALARQLNTTRPPTSACVAQGFFFEYVAMATCSISAPL